MGSIRTFHNLMRESREQANQTPEVMAVLLNMPQEEYEALENWSYPDDETLRRLCLINEWNYYDVQRLIINEMISPARVNRKHSGSSFESTADNPSTIQNPPKSATANVNTLGERLRDVRMVTGQSMEIIAMLLGISQFEYQKLEDGAIPADDLLRRISMIYNWNYQDLLSILRSQDARSFQPSRVGMPFLGNSAAAAKLRAVIRDLESLFHKTNMNDQNYLLAQLELIRDTMRRNHPDTIKEKQPAGSIQTNDETGRSPQKKAADPQPKPAYKPPAPAALEDPSVQTSRTVV